MLTINRVFVTCLTLQEICQTVAEAISIGSIHCIFNQPHRCSIYNIEIITGHVNSLGAAYIQKKMPVPRTGLHVSLSVTVMIAMFTKCLRPICHQYARTYYQKQPCHTRDAILVECSKYRRLRGYLCWL